MTTNDVLIISVSISMARARIFKPAKTAMQSGVRTRKWVLAYEPATRRQPEPLMGWTSAQDTLNEVQLHFDTMEEAVAFATKNALDYTVIAPQESIEKQKSYADNFRYDRTRS
jgi:ETC complex I subunit conserved region